MTDENTPSPDLPPGRNSSSSSRRVLDAAAAARMVRHGVGRDQWDAGVCFMEGLAHSLGNAEEQESGPPAPGDQYGQSANDAENGQEGRPSKRKADEVGGFNYGEDADSVAAKKRVSGTGFDGMQVQQAATPSQEPLVGGTPATRSIGQMHSDSQFCSLVFRPAIVQMIWRLFEKLGDGIVPHNQQQVPEERVLAITSTPELRPLQRYFIRDLAQCRGMVSSNQWIQGFHHMLRERPITVRAERTLSLQTWLDHFCEKANQEMAVVLQKMYQELTRFLSFKGTNTKVKSVTATNAPRASALASPFQLKPLPEAGLAKWTAVRNSSEATDDALLPRLANQKYSVTIGELKQLQSPTVPVGKSVVDAFLSLLAADKANSQPPRGRPAIAVHVLQSTEAHPNNGNDQESAEPPILAPKVSSKPSHGAENGEAGEDSSTKVSTEVSAAEQEPPRLLLYPLLLHPDHWVLVVADTSKRTVSLYDHAVKIAGESNAHSTATDFCNKVLRTLSSESNKIADAAAKPSNTTQTWTLNLSPNNVPQENLANSGTFVCVCAAHLVRRRPLIYDSVQSMWWRNYIAVSLLTGHALDTS